MKMHQIQLPAEDFHSLSQSEAFFYLNRDGGDREKISFHDYGRIYQTQGLYEQIFYDRLRCNSPKVVTDILYKAVQSLNENFSFFAMIFLNACGGGHHDQPVDRNENSQSFGVDDETREQIEVEVETENPKKNEITPVKLEAICIQLLSDKTDKCIEELEEIITTKNITNINQLERVVIRDLKPKLLNKLIAQTFQMFLHRTPSQAEKKMGRDLITGADNVFIGEPVGVDMGAKPGKAMTRAQFRRVVINSTEAYAVRMFHCVAKKKKDKKECPLKKVPEVRGDFEFGGKKKVVHYGFYYNDGLTYFQKPSRKRFNMKERKKIIRMLNSGKKLAQIKKQLKKALASRTLAKSKSVRQAQKKVIQAQKQLKKAKKTGKGEKKASEKLKKAKKNLKKKVAANKKQVKAKKKVVKKASKKVGYKKKQVKKAKKKINKKKKAVKKIKKQLKKKKAAVETAKKKVKKAIEDGKGVKKAKKQLKSAKKQASKKKKQLKKNNKQLKKTKK